jgi:hypothetical protein
MKSLHKLTFIGIVMVLISLFAVQAVTAMRSNVATVQQLYTSSDPHKATSILDAPTLLISSDLAELPLDLDALAELVPATPDDAESKIPSHSGRFILWTHDGVHVVWGRYGNGFFVGTDNAGIRVWGVYRQHVFAGFYGEQLFWGRFRNGRWIAVNLFGQHVAYGQYRLFPYLSPIAIVEEATA